MVKVGEGRAKELGEELKSLPLGQICNSYRTLSSTRSHTAASVNSLSIFEAGIGTWIWSLLQDETGIRQGTKHPHKVQ